MESNFINLSDFNFTLDDLLVSEGLCYGASLFETLYVNPFGIEFFDAHMDRLERGAAVLRISLPKLIKERERLKELLFALFLQTGESQGSLRLQMTCSNGKTLFWGQFKRFLYEPAQYHSGLTVGVKPTSLLEADALSDLKHASYLRHWQGRFDLKEKGYDEYLWLNPKGRLTEGTISNFFFIKDNKWNTPRVSEGILPGTMRGALLASLRQNGVEVREGIVTLADVESAEALFLCNALMAIMPVCQFNDQPMKVDIRLTRWLYDQLNLKRNIF